MNRVGVLAGLLFISLLTGCESGGDPNVPREYKLVPAGGTVTLDGKPLEGAVVTFLQTDESGTTCSAETDENGHYDLAYRMEPGAASASYKVAISYKLSLSGKPLTLNDRMNASRENGAHLAKELIPPENSNLGKTTLKETIPPGGGEFNFALKGPLLDPGTTPPVDPSASPKIAK